MSGFAVIRKEGCDHLSIISGDGLSVVKSFHLPYDRDENLYGGSCGEWSYVLYGFKGDIVLLNLMTPNSIRFLPPPTDFYFPDTLMSATGLGYVAKSDHYKVIRHYVEYHVKTCGSGYDKYEGCTEHFEVCILEHPSRRPAWKDIKGPDIGCSFSGAGVYLNETGRCYWTAHYNLNYSEFQSAIKTGDSLDSQFEFVMSFDFATERFHRFPLPAAMDLGVTPSYKLVVCHGS